MIATQRMGHIHNNLHFITNAVSGLERAFNKHIEYTCIFLYQTKDIMSNSTKKEEWTKTFRKIQHLKRMYYMPPHWAYMQQEQVWLKEETLSHGQKEEEELQWRVSPHQS